MVNIMISTPIIDIDELRIWLSVCWRLWARLSMSLVTRLNRSPRGCESIQLNGRRLILSSTSPRNRNIARCTTPASNHAWM